MKIGLRAGHSDNCFCDSQTDIAIYNQYSWEQLAYNFCNAIDSNIPKERGGSSTTKLGWNESNKSISGLLRWWYCIDLKNAYYYKDVWEQIDGEWYSFDSLTALQQIIIKLMKQEHGYNKGKPHFTFRK